MSEEALPSHPPWLGVKRGAEGQQQPVEGAKLLKAGKGGKKGGKKGKGKNGKGYNDDEHPGANTWDGNSEDWSGENSWQASQWNGEDWGASDQNNSQGAHASSGGGGGRRPQTGRERTSNTAADNEDVTVALSKLTLRNAAELRKAKHLITDFWLIALNTPAVKAGIDGGKEYGALVRERGKGHGLGPPHVTVALRFMHSLHGMAKKAHENEGGDPDAVWAEKTLRDFLKETYNETYGKILATETILDFDVREARVNAHEEGLMRDDHVGGQAKVTMSINTHPQMQVALSQIKDKVDKDKMKDFGAYQTVDLRMAIGFLMYQFGGKKGDAAGPKTQLERVVEANMRKIKGRRGYGY